MIVICAGAFTDTSYVAIKRYAARYSMNKTVFDPAASAKFARAESRKRANTKPYSVEAIPYSHRHTHTYPNAPNCDDSTPRRIVTMIERRVMNGNSHNICPSQSATGEAPLEY